MFMALNMGWIIFWGIAFILILRRGFIDKTFGVTYIGLCVDLAWVTTFTFIFPQSPFMLLFLILDIVFLYQLLKFRTSDLTDVTKFQYYAGVILGVLTSFALIIAFTIEFDDRHGVYSAFINTLIASIFYIVLIMRRNNVQGQSLYIAISKMLGTLSAVIAFNFFTFPDIRPRLVIHIFHEVFNIPLDLSPTPVHSHIGSTLLPVLGICIFFYDVIYIGLVYKKSKELGINPWRRF